MSKMKQSPKAFATNVSHISQISSVRVTLKFCLLKLRTSLIKVLKLQISLIIIPVITAF